MTVFDISVWKVILAIVAYFAIGGVWYMPAVFGKAWQKALGLKWEEMKGRNQAMGVALVGIIIMVVVLTYFAHLTGMPTVVRGGYLGFKLWLGFVATTALITKAFEGGSWQVYLIDMGYHLAGLVVAGLILAS